MYIYGYFSGIHVHAPLQWEATAVGCTAWADRVNSHAAHDIHRDVVHVAAIHQQVSLVVDRWHHAHDGHACPDQPPQGALLVHAGLPLAQVGAVAEVAAGINKVLHKCVLASSAGSLWLPLHVKYCF